MKTSRAARITNQIESIAGNTTHNVRTAGPGIPSDDRVPERHIAGLAPANTTTDGGTIVKYRRIGDRCGATGAVKNPAETTTAANTSQWLYSPLQPNAQYAFRVAATNALGDSAMTDTISTWTLAVQPKAPTVAKSGVDGLSVALGAGDGKCLTEGLEKR